MTIPVNAAGWPLLAGTNELRQIPAYTQALADKLANGDADVAGAINAAQQVADTLDAALAALAAITRTGGTYKGNVPALSAGAMTTVALAAANHQGMPTVTVPTAGVYAVTAQWSRGDVMPTAGLTDSQRALSRSFLRLVGVAATGPSTAGDITLDQPINPSEYTATLTAVIPMAAGASFRVQVYSAVAIPTIGGNPGAGSITVYANKVGNFA